MCLPVADTDTDITAVYKFVGIYGYREFDELSSSADSMVVIRIILTMREIVILSFKLKSHK